MARFGIDMGRSMCEHWIPVELCPDCESNLADNEDIILWPDGVWCYRYELEQMQHKSDDYQVIKFGTEEHERISMV